MGHTSDIYELHLLLEATNWVLEDAKKVNSTIKGAINWGDLCCVNAEWYELDTGDQGYRVWIEEADPGSYELVKFVIEGLTKRGYKNIDVRCEW